MNKLKISRIKSGLSAKAVAAELNVTQQTISYWENGHRQPSMENYIKLAKIYGVPTDCLLEKDIEENEFAAELKKEPVIDDEFSNITEAERQLLKSFRRCNQVDRARVLAYAEGASNQL